MLRIKEWLLTAKTWILGIPYLWLSLFLVLPFLMVFKISFSEMAFGMPPYDSLLTFNDYVLDVHINLNNYRTFFLDDFYVTSYLNSLKVAAFSTIGCLLIGYPMAYTIARSGTLMRSVLLTMVVLPSWTSFLLRVYAWMGILQENGTLNQFLMYIGLIQTPIQFLYTEFAIYLGLIYAYLPFMVLPLYVSLSKMDWLLLQAAADLGARPFKAFIRITLPMTMPSIITGSLLVFIPTVGEFVVPDLLGGSSSKMIGRVVWAEFFTNRDWPLAAALATVMLLILLIPIYYFTRVERKQEEEI